MNYEEHVLAAIISYPIIVLMAGLLQVYGEFPFHLGVAATVLGYAFYVLGGDLPDIDHPNALIHRGAKPLVAVTVGGLVYLKTIEAMGPPSGWSDLTLRWTVAALAALVSWYAFSALMPHHRGVVHSLLFAAIYGLLAFLTAHWGLRLGVEDGAFVGFAAFCGYTLHLLLDRSVKLV